MKKGEFELNHSPKVRKNAFYSPNVERSIPDVTGLKITLRHFHPLPTSSAKVGPLLTCESSWVSLTNGG